MTVIMKRMTFAFAVVVFVCSAARGSDAAVLEPASSLPLAYDVDVVVAGGTLAGVEAACAAADQGARVLLVESRPYVGYDLCGTQKLWLDESSETPETPLTQALFNGKTVVTPLEVKIALDNALLDNGVQFLTGCFPAELLVASGGTPGGVTVVNRSGRQAIRAKVIIDATPDAVLARQSAAPFEPFVPGPKQSRYIVVGGTLQAATNGVSGSQVPGVLYQTNYPVFEYTATVQFDSDTFRSRSAALNQVRSAVYDPSSLMSDHAEHLLYLPDHMIIPAVATSQYSPADMPLGAFRPQGIDNLYVLSAYAGITNALARQQLQESPCNFARVGQRIGVEAAATASGVTTPSNLNYRVAATAAVDRVATEVSPSFRYRDCPQLDLASHDLPVLGRWDVVVVGGGTSGGPAALGAARSGARTLVVEYQDELGGVGTAGLVSRYWYGFRTGFTAEINDAVNIDSENWRPVAKSEWLRAELLEVDAEIWFGSFVCGAVTQSNKVAGVVVATPFGRGVALADVVVDSTGNADVAAAAGAASHYSISALGDLSVQVAGYPHRELNTQFNNTAYAMVNDSDVLDRWHLMLTQRSQRSGKYDMGQLIDARDRRRIIGDYILTTEDILTQRTFPDTISHHKSNFDAGALPDAEMFLVKDMKGPVYTCNMPYRCLTPKGLEGLLVTGLGASVHRDAMTLTRMQADLQNQGYAAGMAAALAAGTTGGVVRDIDIKALQGDLVAAGCLEARVLTDQDSFPMSEQAVSNAVQTLHNLTIDVHMSKEYDDTLPALAVVMGNPETSIPLLQNAYQSSVAPEKKMNFARVLALMGNGTGKQTLIDAVEAESAWGQGWDFSNQRAYANSFGPVDRKVIALGFTRSPEVHAPLLSKLQALDSSSPLSHYKAVCLALRLNKDPSLAEPLADLLNKPGVKGHVQPLTYYDASGASQPLPRHQVNSSGGDQLNAKFKEVLVAALLYECGDDDGQGQEILEAYTQDVNGHFAAYADLVLGDAEQAPPNVIVADYNDLTGGGAGQANQGGGTGLSGNWTGTGTIDVFDEDLTAPVGTGYALTQSGNSRSIKGDYSAARQNYRTLTTALTNNTVWFSFLLHNADATSGGGLGFNQSSWDPVNPLVRSQGSDLLLNGSTVASTVFTEDQTALVLGKITVQDSGNDTFEIWVDPDLSGGEAGLPAPTGTDSASDFFDSAGITNIANISYLNAKLDMIYLSDGPDGFADVTGWPPLPELLAYESFEPASVGSFSAGNKGDLTWSTYGGAITNDKDLTYSGGSVLVNGGNRALFVEGKYSPGTTITSFANFTFAQQTNDVYFSFLASTTSNVFIQLYVSDTPNDDHSGSGTLDTAAAKGDLVTARLQAAGGANRSNSGDIGDSQDLNAFIVGRLSKSGAGNFDTLDMLVSPTSHVEPATWTTNITRDIQIDAVDTFGIRIWDLQDGEDAWIDEVRIGTTFAAVVPRASAGTVCIVK